MFTVKLTKKNKSAYFETNAFDVTKHKDGFIELEFMAQNEQKKVFFKGVSDSLPFPTQLVSVDHGVVFNSNGIEIDRMD